VLKGKCLTEEPNACVQSIAGQNILPVFYWVSYIVVCLHLMMNLVIAVILDGYEEGKHTPPEQKEMELCMERWKKYDPDITEKLPMPKALCFINEVVAEILRQQAKEQEATPRQEMAEEVRRDKKVLLYTQGSHSDDVDIGAMPMQFARCFDLNLLPDGQVDFAAATRQVMRIAVLGGKDDLIDDLDVPLKSLDKKTAQKLKQLLQRKRDAGVDIKLVVAATKLQRRWRKHQAIREEEEQRQEEENADTEDIKRAKPSQGGGSKSRTGSSGRLPSEKARDGFPGSPKDSGQDLGSSSPPNVGKIPERDGSPPKAGGSELLMGTGRGPSEVLVPPRAG